MFRFIHWLQLTIWFSNMIDVFHEIRIKTSFRGPQISLIFPSTLGNNGAQQISGCLILFKGGFEINLVQMFGVMPEWVLQWFNWKVGIIQQGTTAASFCQNAPRNITTSKKWWTWVLETHTPGSSPGYAIYYLY